MQLKKIERIVEAIRRRYYARLDGGPGSGHFNHQGNPGTRGGSLPRGSGTGANVPCLGFANKRRFRYHVDKHLSEFQGMTGKQYQERAIELLQQPCGEDIDGYIEEDGRIVRYNRKTGEFAVGVPGGYVRTLFRPKYEYETGKQNLKKANAYFERHKAKEAWPKEKPGKEKREKERKEIKGGR